jgi:hypothetical protein
VGSPELHARASSGAPLASGSETIHLEFSANASGPIRGSGAAVVLELDLGDVTIEKLVGGTESCSLQPLAGTCAAPVDTLYVEFETLRLRQDTHTWTWRADAQPGNPHRVPDSTFAFSLAADVHGTDRATSFRGPSQSFGDGWGAAEIVAPGDGLDDDWFLRRRDRLVALLEGFEVPRARVTVVGGTAANPRAYELANATIDSISYSGLTETIALTPESMTWTNEDETAGTTPPAPPSGDVDGGFHQ